MNFEEGIVLSEKNKIKIILIFGLVLSAKVIFASALLEHEIAKAEKYIIQKKWSRAIAQLEKSCHSFQSGSKETAELKVLIVSCYNGDQKYSKALKILKSLKSYRPFNWRLEESKALLGLKKYDQAIESTKYYTAKDGLHVYIPALWVRAQAQMSKKSYRPCMKTCRSVMYLKLKKNPKGLADFKLSDAVYKKLVEFKKKAKELFYEAREAYDIITYGKDFAIYRKAREAQFKGEYEKARELYKEIADGTLKEAAKCYYAECYLAEGNFKKASRLYKGFLEEDPLGLYRGEMLYKLAEAYYINDNLSKAFITAGQLRNWWKSVEEAQNSVKLEKINNALKKDIIDTAPKTFLKKDDCGNLLGTTKYPGTINNRLTSPWYLPSLKVKGELLYGFFLGEKRKTKDAAIAFSDAKKLTNMQIIRDRLAIKKLKTGLIEESYLISKKDAKKLRKYENKIKLACFYYQSDAKEDAEKLFDSVIKNANKRQYTLDVATSYLGKVNCLICKRKTQEAIKIVNYMMKNKIFDDTPALLEARYLRACLLAKNKGTFKQAVAEFDALSKKRRTKVAPMAMLAKALAATNHHKKELAIESCRALQAKYRNHPIGRTAATLSKALAKTPRNKKYPISIVSAWRGKVILHRRVVVMPATIDWERIHAKVASADIILYQIKFIPKGNCSIVRTVWMNLDPGEPSPPDAIGDEIFFVRAPVLFNKSLLYDLSILEKKL